MRIGKLAEQVGVTPDTIRYYEAEGLLAPPSRTPSGYRDYGPEAVDDLRFIRKAQALGLRLSDVREVMEIAAGARAPCEHVRARIEARLKETERRLRELRELRASLRKTLEALEDAPEPAEGCRCPVIEAV
ncbi:MAG: heavy metal-responsive transcriptional regulator [Gemmatimonadota bacterium]